MEKPLPLTFIECDYLNADKFTENHQKHECSIIYTIYKIFVYTNPASMSSLWLGIKQLAPTMWSNDLKLDITDTEVCLNCLFLSKILSTNLQ